MLEAFETGYLSKFEGSFTPDPPFSFYGGPYVQSLEKEWSNYYGMKHSISVNSATSGLYAAYGALGLGFGDEIIVPAITMTACAVGAMIYGAIPIFADVEVNTGNISPDSIEELITPRTRAILVVHLYGFPANMQRICQIAKKYGIKIIEDCAQAHGAQLQGKLVGTFSDISIFSLNVNKTIQTGEGGLCLTNDPDLAYRLQLIRNHGEAVVGPAGYQKITNILGFNYRLTELQAAIGLTQLKQLNDLTKDRLKLVDHLRSSLNQFPQIQVYNPPEDQVATYYQFKFLIPELEKNEGDQFRKAVNSEGCYFFSGYKPLYTQPVYQKKLLFKSGYPWSAEENKCIATNYDIGSCPTAEYLTDKTCTNEHIRPPNTVQDIEDIVKIFEKVLG